MNPAALERHQASIYLASVAAALLLGLLGLPPAPALIDPALVLMMFATFLQVPLVSLGRAFAQGRFLAALLLVNFVLVPLLVWAMLPWLPEDPLWRFGVLLVLLAPCIDYVVAFAHLGRADARLLLAATPWLLGGQMLLLPVYLGLLLGGEGAVLLRPGPFVQAFLLLIVLPLLLAALLQFAAARRPGAARWQARLGWLPVPATALVLFVVVASVAPFLASAADVAWRVAPLYLAFAVMAPWLGWWTGRAAGLPPPASRALAFSGATRNSLVVLPLALAVPGAMPALPVIVVTQTLIELLAELAYVRWLPRLGKSGT